jgi:hypothetical protein
VWARVRDRNGELFSYYVELRGDGRPLPPFAERCLERGATGGPSYVEGGPGEADGVLDLPCSLYSLDLSPSDGWRDAEIDVWGVETDVLAPPLEPQGQPAGGEQP